MSKKIGGGKNSPTLPDEVQHLITRKLRQRQREQEKLLISAKQIAYSKLHVEVVANNRTGRAFTSVPLAVYREIVTNATATTKEWPGIVWETISSTLEKAQVLLRDGLVLNKIVDEFAWAIGQPPFTLSYIDPERFKGTVRREAGRYGMNQQDVLAEFDRQLGLPASMAHCEILEAARQAREDIGIAIDEYLLTQQRQVSQARQAKAGTDLPAKVSDARSDCLPNMPQKVDDWFLAIKDMTLAFYGENQRCPNEVEAWARLRTNPPDTYGIVSGEHHGEQAVLMHGQALGKRSFNDRWRRYTHAKLRNKPQ
jgi:hypothetical protein